ncbi:hypothetical protein Dimus_024718, partial [Dionaea muscipula]
LTGHRGPSSSHVNWLTLSRVGLQLSPPASWHRRLGYDREKLTSRAEKLTSRAGLRKASNLHRSRTLMKKINRALAEDDELRAHLDCRCSRQFSPSLLSNVSDLGSVTMGGLPPTDMAEVSRGVCSVVEESPENLQESSSSIGIPDDFA